MVITQRLVGAGLLDVTKIRHTVNTVCDRKKNSWLSCHLYPILTKFIKHICQDGTNSITSSFGMHHVNSYIPIILREEY